MLGDRNLTEEDKDLLRERKDKMEKCRQDVLRLFEFDKEHVKESMDLDDEFAITRANLEESLEENRAPCSDENRAPTTEESSSVDKSKSTEEESSSVDKSKSTEEGEGPSPLDKGKRKATDQEVLEQEEQERKRSRVDGPSSDENQGSLVEDYADVSTEMPSYMDPDDG